MRKVLIVQDHIVGSCQSIFPGDLSCDNRLNLFWGIVVAGNSAADLQFDGNVDYQNAGAGFVLLCFEQQGIRENSCLLYTSPSPRDQRGSRMPSSA